MTEPGYKPRLVCLQDTKTAELCSHGQATHPVWACFFPCKQRQGLQCPPDPCTERHCPGHALDPPSLPSTPSTHKTEVSGYSTEACRKKSMEEATKKHNSQHKNVPGLAAACPQRWTPRISPPLSSGPNNGAIEWGGLHPKASQEHWALFLHPQPLSPCSSARSLALPVSAHVPESLLPLEIRQAALSQPR